MFTRERAKEELKSKGWSYRKAAPYLNVTYQHVCLVLAGKRESQRLLRLISKLPNNNKGARS